MAPNLVFEPGLLVLFICVATTPWGILMVFGFITTEADMAADQSVIYIQ